MSLDSEWTGVGISTSTTATTTSSSSVKLNAIEMTGFNTYLLQDGTLSIDKLSIAVVQD